MANSDTSFLLKQEEEKVLDVLRKQREAMG